MTVCFDTPWSLVINSGQLKKNAENRPPILECSQTFFWPNQYDQIRMTIAIAIAINLNVVIPTFDVVANSRLFVLLTIKTIDGIGIVIRKYGGIHSI